MKNLEKIKNKFSEIAHNGNNYSVGGGLSVNQFASNRHEDAKYDEGKMTLGTVAQMFRKATGENLKKVKEIINYAIPNMEWHHAGMLPKAYGGGMGRTYFLNSLEIVDLAENWERQKNKLDISKEEERKEKKIVAQIRNMKEQFLSENAIEVVRVAEPPELFFEINREMKGKFGWFCSYEKKYKLPEYYTGWVFDDVEKMKKYYEI